MTNVKDMIKTYFQTKNSRQLKILRQVRDGAWINAENIENDDLAFIQELTSLERADLDDILDPYELPRLERADNNLIIFIRTPRQAAGNGEGLHTAALTIICTDKYFITLSPERNQIVHSLLAGQFPAATTQRSKLLIYILLRTSQVFTQEIRRLRKEVAARQSEIRRIGDADIAALVESEEILNQYISALIPLNNVLETIAEGKLLQLFDDDNDLFQDMIISTRQSLDLCSASIKSIKSVLDSYQIIFTNRLNKKIQILTLFTILLTIPTVIGSLFGMNVRLPLGEHPLAFGYIMLLILGLMILFVIYYRKKIS